MPSWQGTFLADVTTGLVAAAVALAVAAGFGFWRRQRDGVARPGRAETLTRDDLGTGLGGRATLLQFSSEYCAPCRATARILAEVAEDIDGVSHVEVDAQARLDLVRRLGVRRTPTTFVLGPQGQVTHRVSGQPRKADMVAALTGTPLSGARNNVRIHGDEH
jgi:thiol-disulfide isomerase/thioredoxin